MRRVLVLSVLVALSASAPAALAHGELLEARPAPGAVVGGDVVEIELRFEEALKSSGVEIVVTGSDGVAVDLAEPRIVADAIVRATFDHLVDPGVYRVEYRVESVDDFVFEGAYLFTYEPSAPPVDSFPEGRTSTGATVLIAAVGTVLFAVGGWLLMRRQSRRIRGA
ncbi:MAG: copper resistance protein CopC [Acidimicrobiia bacterium]|nr:copper resistance protein CopC [Acidimicrobiia bacterium]